jgi:hypothetical protein
MYTDSKFPPPCIRSWIDTFYNDHLAGSRPSLEEDPFAGEQISWEQLGMSATGFNFKLGEMSQPAIFHGTHGEGCREPYIWPYTVRIYTYIKRRIHYPMYILGTQILKS